MSKPKADQNKQIIYMKDVLGLSFSEIAVASTLAGRKLTESVTARIYKREKLKENHE